jgi:hypothetical protein
MGKFTEEESDTDCGGDDGGVPGSGADDEREEGYFNSSDEANSSELNELLMNNMNQILK